MVEHHSTRLRGVLYGRRSSNLQERSIPQQLEWGRGAAKREAVDIAREFVDDALSGTEATRRDAFQAMLAFCQEEKKSGRPIDVIVLWNTDRFSRADSLETGWYVHEYRKAGVDRLLTAERWFDFNRREDRAVFGITQEYSNNLYSEDLARKSLRGRIEAAKEGRSNGGSAPFGYLIEYEWVTIRGKQKQRPLRLTPDPEKSPVLKWIFTEYASGRVSLWELAQALEARGIKPPGRARFWNTTTLTFILRNEVYLGDSIWNRRQIGKFFGTLDNLPCPRTGRHDKEEKVPPQHHVRKAQAHEALIDRDLWDAVQLQLAKRKKLTTPILDNDFRLTGLLACGHCHGRMVAAHKPFRGRATRGQHYKIYLCGNYSHHGRRACNRNAIEEGPLFLAICRKVKAELFTEDTMARLLAIAQERAGNRTTPAAAERERVARRLREVEGLLSAAALKLIREEMPAVLDICRQEIVRLTDERDRLQAALAEADRRPVEGEEDPAALVARVEAKARRFEKAMEEGDPAEVRAVLGELVERVELFFGHEQGGRGVMCEFVKGLVYLRDDRADVTLLSSTSPHDGQESNKIPPLLIFPADLAAA
jgi:DNA invertase Pin-like site-specific DNA recombinase